MWAALAWKIPLSAATATAVATMSDDVVALLALDAEAEGRRRQPRKPCADLRKARDFRDIAGGTRVRGGVGSRCNPARLLTLTVAERVASPHVAPSSDGSERANGVGDAAEVGTMVVSEEIDALRVMGLDPSIHVAPKYLAALITVPCLTC